MEIRGKTICGFDAIQIRDALRAFVETEKPVSIKNGSVKITRRTLKKEFLAKELGISKAAASTLLSGLISEGYIDGEKLTPASHGMALIGAEDRDRLPLDKAIKLVEEFLEAVRIVNAKPGARILIDRVHVFGSYLKNAESVGDIDLLIEAPLPSDCQPEDMDELDIALAEIKISEYLSFHDEFDPTASAAEKQLIYEREIPGNSSGL